MWATGILRRFRGAAEKVNYPFGYGLSYTSFAIRNCCGRLEKAEGGTQIVVEASVTNVGKLAGKEVVQLYYSARLCWM